MGPLDVELLRVAEGAVPGLLLERSVPDAEAAEADVDAGEG